MLTVYQYVGGKNGCSQKNRDLYLDDYPCLCGVWRTLGLVSSQLAADPCLDRYHGLLCRGNRHGEIFKDLKLPDLNNH